MNDLRSAGLANTGVNGTLALVLAGGNGSRLHGLTESRAKPAVPFGGHCRTVDFTLSNCVNSGIRRIAVLTQYKSQSLIRHIHQGWRFCRPELGEFLEIWPAQQRCGKRWYTGTADAVHQNRDLIAELDPDHVLVLAGDHVYAMDYGRMLESHRSKRADITIACVEVPLAEASAYGIVEQDESRRVLTFLEKPEHPTPIPGKPGLASASMGIYLFNRELLFDCLEKDAANPHSANDFGRSILPRALQEAQVYAHEFRDARTGTPMYWRDVGTIDGYWQAHMDLISDPPAFDLFDEEWPIWTHEPQGYPTRIANAVRVDASVLGRSCHIDGDISSSVLSANCRVDRGSKIKESVLLPNVRVGRSCWLDRVIVDSNCVIPDNTIITPAELPFECGYHVSRGGVVLLDADTLAGSMHWRRGAAEVA